MTKRSTLISLLDVALYVQREIAHYQASRRNPRNPQLDPSWRRYDSSGFMAAILRDVFDNTAEEHPSEYLVKAKAFLTNAGMNPNAAHKLCNDTFNQMVDCISAQLPHLVFHDTSTEVYADMSGNWDVVITEFIKPMDDLFRTTIKL